MSMEFYAALTVSRNQIRHIASRLIAQYGSIEPIRNVIFTPISMGAASQNTLHDLRDKYDLRLMYDSGGYDVQTGDKSFDDLPQFLIDYYEAHQDAYRYVLPDNVPVNGDDRKTIERKINETLSASRNCYKRLPASIQGRAVGVVQGHSQDHLSRCLKTYHELGLDTVAFGSFGTGGKNNGVNMLTSEALENLQWVVHRAHEYGMEVHALGIGGPTSIPLLEAAGVDSFDSSTWFRTSGYGNVFFPFKSRLNASHRKIRSGRVLQTDEFHGLKRETGHECPFCETMDQLRDDRWNRVLHNLIVTYEMSQEVEEMSQEAMVHAMDKQSTYRSRLEVM